MSMPLQDRHPTARRPDEAQPYHVAWVGEVMAYQVYRDAGPLRRLWMTLRRDKTRARGRPVYLLSQRAYDTFDAAWNFVETWAGDHHDWHGVGYARNMQAAALEAERRFALAAHDGAHAIFGNPWLMHRSDEPNWVYDLYHRETISFI